MKRSNPFPARRLGALACALAATVPALAQESSRRVLEEIVVTAEHREATLQETQISLAAFDAQTLADMGVSTGRDLGYSVPNVVPHSWWGRSTLTYAIRGIQNAETLITFDPATSVYLDGVLIGKNAGGLLDVLELERIEILRGPQGTLYGRNTIGGAVNYVTRKPSDQFEGRVKATLGNYDLRDWRAMVNLPLAAADSPIGELALRASGALIERDGTEDNVFPAAPQDELGTKDREVALLHLLWRPVDSLEVRYGYDRTRIDETPSVPWVVTVNPNGFTAFLAPFDQRESRRPDEIQLNDPVLLDSEVDGHALEVRWEIDERLTFSSLTGARELKEYSYFDSDGSPFSLIFPRDLQEFESFSQEFRLVGDAFGERLQFSTGLYLYEEEGDLWNQTDVFGRPNSLNVADFDNESWAIYGQFTWAFNERLELTLGGRYTDEQKEMRKVFITTVSGLAPIETFSQVAPRYAGTSCTTTPQGAPSCRNTRFPDAEKSFDNFTPMVSLAYHWNPDVMTYAKVATGYQAGGFNVRDQLWSDFTRGFDEEKLTSYEVGLKGTFADRFRVNAAAFFSDYDDKLVNQFNPETLVSVQVNAGQVEIWGVELELAAQLTDRLQAGLNYGHQRPKYVEYKSRPDPVTGEVTDLSDTAYFPHTPNNTYSAFLLYEQPLALGLLRARLDWSYRDEMNFLAPKPERNESKGAEIVNARVGLSDLAGPGRTRISAYAWVKNLFDEGYWVNGVNLYNTFGFDINGYGEPRTFGAELTVEF